MADPHPDVGERIVTSIRGFLSLIEPDGQGEAASLADLAQALDGLVSTYFSTVNVEPDTIDSSPPRVDHRHFDQGAAAAFPELGYYAIAEPNGDIEQKVGLGDAPSDLAEIAADLINVLWLFENAGANDAIFDFRFGYQTHWGRHAHELRLYLHSMAAW